MKYCPTCQITYADESLRFCLQDGTGLREVSGAAPLPTQDFREPETVVRQAPVTNGWANRASSGATLEPEVKSGKTLLAVIATAAAMCLLFGGIGIGWLLLGGNQTENKNSTALRNEKTNSGANTKITTPDINTVNANARPSPTSPLANTGRENQNDNVTGLGGIGWEPIDYNASLNGERITYYPGTIAGECQKDCRMNPKCVAFTYIRAGAYNPQDSAMCYLMSKVTGTAYATCCISGISK
jgi:hypothetical protein